MPAQQKAKAKGRKIGRGIKHQCTIYKTSGRQESGRKRRMRRHLRNHPNDIDGIAFFEKEIGKFDRNSLLSKGRKVLARAS